MSTIFNILAMHRSQELAEQLQDGREELAKKKHAQVMDICQELADTMGTEAYQAWLYRTPTKGFSQAAEQKLLDLKVPAAWQDGTEPSPIIYGGEILYLQTPVNSDDSIPF